MCAFYIQVKVGIRVIIIAVGDIDNVKQEFTVDIYLRAIWKEPTLKGKKQEEVDWSQAWDPRITLLNEVAVLKKTIKHFLVYEEPDDVPEVRFSMRMTVTLKENLELNEFPFDHQDLTIRLSSDWPIKQIEFEKDMSIKDAIRTDQFSGQQEWKLYPHLICEPVTPWKEKSAAHNQYPLYNITLQVKRKPGFYMWNVILVMFCIMLLTISSFTVEASAPADRLGVTLTLLLTSVAFKFVVSQQLPAVSYLTYLDIYVISCMTIQFLVGVQNAVASLLIETTARLFDLISVCVLTGSIVIIHLVMGIIVVTKWFKQKKTLEANTEKFHSLCDVIDMAWRRKMAEKAAMEASQEQGEKTHVSDNSESGSKDASGKSIHSPGKSKKKKTRHRSKVDTEYQTLRNSNEVGMESSDTAETNLSVA
ncbi:uncharacterized protein LOC106180157 [Lingula anatina]|uniref:Uncharacterized protein LOC106180157 n=1 Tax=Lingula anatina TaxID=7574 RepID=A0A1S3KA58_LINAN|nr:uncharacterized protein LOC106180157 [Lingula anatina]|eukprot:XP_013419513.1 uncharacterized protein LOC106180157 [Lingula anatina]